MVTLLIWFGPDPAREDVTVELLDTIGPSINRSSTTLLKNRVGMKRSPRMVMMGLLTHVLSVVWSRTESMVMSAVSPATSSTFVSFLAFSRAGVGLGPARISLSSNSELTVGCAMGMEQRGRVTAFADRLSRCSSLELHMWSASPRSLNTRLEMPLQRQR